MPQANINFGEERTVAGKNKNTLMCYNIYYMLYSGPITLLRGLLKR
jgi:hypothetical protein